MKNNIYITFFSVVILFGITSCKKELDISPVGSLSPEIVGAAEASKLLTGVYDGMQSGSSAAGGDFSYLSYAAQDLSADNLVYRATFFQHGEIDDNKILTNNVLVSRFFNHPYVPIQRANDLIAILESNPDIPDDVKNPILGQAHFLRGYAYFRLVTFFGPVPIVLNRDITKVPRNTVSEVYKQIIDDALATITLGPAFTNSDYGSIEAAKALLARVYLIMNDMPNAKKYAEEVIASGKFTVSDSYSAIFTKPFVNSEHIFKLNFTATEAQNSLPFFLQHASMPGGGRAELPVDSSLVAAFEAGDTRKDATIQQITTAPAGWYVKKYQDSAGDDAVPMFIFRISEMYLISAEAQFRISNNANDTDVLGRFNAVRTKRGLAAKTSLTLQDIIQERRVELAIEGTRWIDMRRTPSPTNPSKSMATVYLEVKGRGVNDELYPIPQSAITTNDLLLPNNPGY